MSDITGEEFGERVKAELARLCKLQHDDDETCSRCRASVYIGELEEAIATAKARIAELQRANESLKGEVDRLRWRPISEKPEVHREGDYLPTIEVLSNGDPMRTAWDGEGWVAMSTLGGNRHFEATGFTHWRYFDSPPPEHLCVFQGSEWQDVRQTESAIDAARAREGK